MKLLQMIPWRPVILLFVVASCFFQPAWGQKLQLLKTTHLPHYPSASALEYYGNRLFVMGDDAPYILVTDNRHRAVDSIVLFPSKEKRISKDEKADIESATVVASGKKTQLALFSSFSDKNRDRIIYIDLQMEPGKEKCPVYSYTSDIQLSRIPEINLEGAALVKGQLVFSNRPNNTHRRNYLVVTPFRGEKGFTSKEHHVIAVNLPAQKEVTGISGLAYLKEEDLLLFTASSENTGDATADGAIGDSFLGYIDNFSEKLSNNSVQPPMLIPLAPVFGKGNVHKIESIAVEESNRSGMILHLAADNDNGESTLFKVKMTW